MKLSFFNSLTGKKEEFTPLEPGKVSIYNCGVTVYDKCHLGHARGAVNFDVLRRFLQGLGYHVTYVKNYTDIDDKIINRAAERGISISDLTQEMINLHDRDMAALGIQPPDFAPKATECVPAMQAIIQTLIDKGFAYASQGDVYFRVAKDADYGKLSKKSLDDLIAGHRVEPGEQKENPLDFALWKANKGEAAKWESPWGPGRPGWHIECSAMIESQFHGTIDIHAGGSDLIFPHHENEIAQSESAFGRPFARFWLHNGMIQIQSQKMSKSLGNFATLEDLLQTYHPELLRFFILSSQYRASINFSHEALLESLEGLNRIYESLSSAALKWHPLEPAAPAGEIVNKQQEFQAALADDLNTPMAIAVMFELARSLNTSKNRETALQIYSLLLETGNMLGMLQVDAQDWFFLPKVSVEKQRIALTEAIQGFFPYTHDAELQEALKAAQANGNELAAREIKKFLQIENHIAARMAARAAKDWALADRIRDQLAALKVEIKDLDGKTHWRFR